MKLEAAERPAKLAIDNDVPSSVVADETTVYQFNLHICAVSQVLFRAIVQNSFMFVQRFNTPRLNLLNIDE